MVSVVSVADLNVDPSATVQLEGFRMEHRAARRVDSSGKPLDRMHELGKVPTRLAKPAGRLDGAFGTPGDRSY